MSEPQYKIHGKPRRKLKSELSLLRGFVKGFWRNHQFEKDMYWIHGCDASKLMHDEDAEELVSRKKKEIKSLEEMLSEPYENNID